MPRSLKEDLFSGKAVPLVGKYPLGQNNGGADAIGSGEWSGSPKFPENHFCGAITKIMPWVNSESLEPIEHPLQYYRGSPCIRRSLQKRPLMCAFKPLSQEL